MLIELNEVVILKKPSSLVQLWGYIFIILGPIFILSGYLNRFGILPTSPNSKGDPSMIFPILGIIILIVGLITFLITVYKESERIKLKTTGLKVQGVVTRIRKLEYTKWGNQSPYTINFYYKRYGCKYEGKSFLVWDKPTVTEGEKVEVYINDDKRHHCFVEV